MGIVAARGEGKILSSNPPHLILVVDDEPDLEQLVRQRMRRDIRSGKFAFLFAHDGMDALEKLKGNESVDLVLSDINMPRMDGLTLLEKIPEVNDDLRAVVISAYGDIKNIRAAMNRGAFDFVTKPIDFKDLRTTINRGLQQLTDWREAEKARGKLVSLQSELTVAHNMQQSVLPKSFPKTADYELYGIMVPARNVGGDFYDFFPLEDGKIGLAIGDVSDKGVPAALFMMASRTTLKGAAIGTENPGDALKVVNEQLEDGNTANMFVTLFYTVYNPATGVLNYSNGGHNPPLILRPDGTSELLDGDTGIALGIMAGMQFESQTVTLQPGQFLFLYTDGVSEATNPEEEEFGLERLRRLFAESPPGNSKEASQLVLKAVREFARTHPQSDDITCAVLHRLG